MLGGQRFEYDREKNEINIKKHGISFEAAARVFFDEDYIEEYDWEHSDEEQRYNVIGDTSAGNITYGYAVIGRIRRFYDDKNDILYVVYTERSGSDVIRIISARLANNFERGLYYGQYL